MDFGTFWPLIFLYKVKMGRNFERKYFRHKIRYLNSVKSVWDWVLQNKLNLQKWPRTPPYRLKEVLCANFQVKLTSDEWGVAFYRLFFQIPGQSTIIVKFCAIFCFDGRPSNDETVAIQSQWALFETRKDRSITYANMNEKEEVRFYPPPTPLNHAKCLLKQHRGCIFGTN